jgi:hypothetical protein
MKQGKASPNGMAGSKQQPVSHAVSVDKVANIGLQIVRTQPPSKSLYKGKGFMAPPLVSCKTSNSGSQGNH